MSRGARRPEGRHSMNHVKPSILLLLTAATIGTVASAEEGRMSSLVEGNSQFAVDLYGKLGTSRETCSSRPVASRPPWR